MILFYVDLDTKCSNLEYSILNQVEYPILSRTNYRISESHPTSINKYYIPYNQFNPNLFVLINTNLYLHLSHVQNYCQLRYIINDSGLSSRKPLTGKECQFKERYKPTTYYVKYHIINWTENKT